MAQMCDVGIRSAWIESSDVVDVTHGFRAKTRPDRHCLIVARWFESRVMDYASENNRRLVYRGSHGWDVLLKFE